MKFIETNLPDAYVIEVEPFEDERGFFARTFCKQEFKSRNINPNLAQMSIAFNTKKGTLRGMHYMLPPNEEAKVVRCTRGAIFDVIIDLRPKSPTFKQWFSTELTEDNYKMVYLPESCAHGYVTLQDNTEVLYQMSIVFVPESYAGVRWDDPAFKIKWPKIDNLIISDKDKSYPDFK